MEAGITTAKAKVRRCCLILAAALLLGVFARGAVAAEPLRVLFVGNSQVYTANLPAVLDALGEANGRPIDSEMLVKGGATLAERVADGSVERVLDQRHFDVVVLQERGGDLICPRTDICEAAQASVVAVKALAATIREHDAAPVLLGTYQRVPRVSELLLVTETRAARDASMPYVAVSGAYVQGLDSHPELPWHDPDGGHPGGQLALLDAVLLYRELFDTWPGNGGFAVTAPMYTPHTRFFPPLLASEKVLVRDELATGHDYSSAAVSAALALAKATRP